MLAQKEYIGTSHLETYPITLKNAIMLASFTLIFTFEPNYLEVHQHSDGRLTGELKPMIFASYFPFPNKCS